MKQRIRPFLFWSMVLSVSLVLSACSKLTEIKTIRLPWTATPRPVTTPPLVLDTEWGVRTPKATIKIRADKQQMVSEFVPLYFGLKNKSPVTLTGVKLILTTGDMFFVRGSETASPSGARFSPAHEFTFTVPDIPAYESLYPLVAVYSMTAGKGEMRASVVTDQKGTQELSPSPLTLEIVEVK